MQRGFRGRRPAEFAAAPSAGNIVHWLRTVADRDADEMGFGAAAVNAADRRLEFDRRQHEIGMQVGDYCVSAEGDALLAQGGENILASRVAFAADLYDADILMGLRGASP